MRLPCSETLAPIKDCQDRDALYLQIIKPLAPTRPQLAKILVLLEHRSPSLQAAISTHLVQQALAKAVKSTQPAATLIKHLHQRSDAQGTARLAGLESRVDRIRRTYFGARASRRDFHVTVSAPGADDELIINFRLKKGETKATLERLIAALEEGDLFADPPKSDAP